LDEADVNLGVALYLWGLLEDAGAEVVLTRKTDRDFAGGDSLRLRDDLQARVDVVNSVKPDLFVSLHHNAGISVDTSFTEIQVYFKMSDAGPSLDVARIVARHLRTNLGETGTRVIPGNYYVLRNSAVPSILCEPSYITNRQVESRLKLAEKQRLEAEIYFLALVDYFSRGIPRPIAFGPEDTDTTGLPMIDIEFDPASLVDAVSVTVSVDDEKLRPFRVGPNRFGAVPGAPLPSGKHRVRAAARSITGNSSPWVEWMVYVKTQPAVLTLSVTPACPHPGFPQKIEAVVIDRNGNPVADSTAVVFAWAGGETERPTTDGRASAFVPGDIPSNAQTIIATCGNLTESRRTLPCVEGRADAKTGFTVDTEGRAVEGAMVADARTGDWAVSDRDGYFVIGPDVQHVRVSKQGYREAEHQIEGNPVVTLRRLYPGLPAGVVVAIDPRGGGEDTGWVGTFGTIASDLNLAVAGRLAGLLSSAGITAHLTRDSNRDLGGEDRVMRCEAWNSALVVSVGHDAASTEGVSIEHYPGSPGGIKLSEYMGQELRALAGYDADIGDTDDYIVLQTSCPAVKIIFLSPSTPEDEGKLSEPSFVWSRAYAVFCAILKYLGIDETETFSISGQVLDGGKACAGALVVVDGTLEVIADESGEFRVKLLEKSPQVVHRIQAFSGGRLSDAQRFSEQDEFVELSLE
jgi:N-acetylmuramoyl-L-alanine amidase